MLLVMSNRVWIWTQACPIPKYVMIEDPGIGSQPEQYMQLLFWHCPIPWMPKSSNVWQDETSSNNFLSLILETWNSRHRRAKIRICCCWTCLYSCFSFSLTCFHFSLSPTTSWVPASLRCLYTSLLWRGLNGGVCFKSNPASGISISTLTQTAKTLIALDTGCIYQ